MCCRLEVERIFCHWVCSSQVLMVALTCDRGKPFEDNGL